MMATPHSRVMASGRKREAGITLVEVLAGLAVASLVLVSLNLAMTTIERSVGKTRQTLGNQAAVSTAAGLFVRDVSRIAKIRRGGGTPTKGYLFEGSAQQMVFPVTERQGLSSRALYMVRMRVSEDRGIVRLIRERTPFAVGKSPGTNWDDSVVLLEGAFDIAFAYRAQRSGSRSWTDDWSGASSMPEQVRLTIGDSATGRLRAPVIVQSLLIEAEIECSAAGAECNGPQAEQNQ